MLIKLQQSRRLSIKIIIAFVIIVSEITVNFVYASARTATQPLYILYSDNAASFKSAYNDSLFAECPLQQASDCNYWMTYFEQVTNRDYDSAQRRLGFKVNSNYLLFLYDPMCGSPSDSVNLKFGYYDKNTGSLLGKDLYFNCISKVENSVLLKNSAKYQNYASTFIDENVPCSLSFDFKNTNSYIRYDGAKCLVNTNIPMFSSYEDAVSYYNGTNTNCMVNKAMVDANTANVYDSSVEAPQNFIAKYNSAGPEDSVFDIILKWEQSATISDRKTEVFAISEGKFFLMNVIGKKSKITDFKTDMMFDKTVDSPSVSNEYSPPGLINLMDKYKYRSDSFQPWKTVNSADGILTHVQQEDTHYYYYIRNVVNHKTSDWVMVHLDLKNLPETDVVVSSPIGGKYSVGGTYQVSGGVTKVLDGSASTDSVANGSASVKDSYNVQGTTVAGGGSSNNTGIVQEIKNGFGLIGTGGLISFFAQLFTFIPPLYFSLLTGGISTCIAIAVFKFLRG